jgi:branched-chain amino acid transport system permease protein
LRLAGLVNGWVLFWGVALVAVGVRGYVGARSAAVAQPDGGVGRSDEAAPVPAVGAGAGTRPDAADAADAADAVPVEWWGLRRPWRAEDEEVLDRAVARG